MDYNKVENNIMRRIRAMNERVQQARAEDLYFYNQPISELRGGARIIIG
jgi:hypothetical protein